MPISNGLHYETTTSSAIFILKLHRMVKNKNNTFNILSILDKNKIKFDSR